MAQQFKLIDNKEKNQYEFHIDGYIPLIEYMNNQNGSIYLTHTEVPLELEGQGVGTRLVQEVLEDIEQRGLHVVPLCSFVAGYIEKHPEWEKIVDQDK